jgi:hypothetical protein
MRIISRLSGKGPAAVGGVAKNILAAISCVKESAAASISYVVGKFLQHYRVDKNGEAESIPPPH